MQEEFEKKFDYEVIYLGQSENSYREDCASSPSIKERLAKLLENTNNRKARELMLRAVLRLDYVLTESDSKNDKRSYDIQLIETVRQIATDMVQVLPVGDQEGARKFIGNLDKSPWLFSHLDETGHSIADFFENTRQVTTGENELLSSRQMELMEFVGRTHDVCKLLGGLNAQIDPDHEIIYREIIGRHLEGKTFTTKSGHTIVFDKDDVDFIKGVVELHEDIYREEGFAHQAESLKKENNSRDLEVAIARGRTILHFVDIFGDAVRFQDGVLKIVDQKAFEKRFIDLFRRHIKLPIVSTDTKIITVDGIDQEKTFITDWSLGKVFRPQWGEHGVAGLTWTFGLLKDEWGINVDPALIPAVQNGIIQVLEEAVDAIEGVRRGDPKYHYQQGVIPEKVQAQFTIDLEKLKLSLTALNVDL
ncbi:hypothetical protein A3K29_03770 [Candidatus Collierbacteria bacterium RIFOXYB2_FULL_46_14]|uniref:HD domain-containing protein n=1 Tax=Candidatus Collierbacteria bacterium GW2011_GWA2_46_26 TaxID=1618381 RepID=A0A0G1PIW6_9BACT|nr:MAG: hypothetical protein UW29_C0007G0042 [Candidatus Collierbacteria bacterium GW2011_GWC2_44_13]KKU32691.1 MAG: hypothetical protein UX47_C0008G0048 [Candidatus Collierbacteria bacterium GW2011_GWA2_46_26]OGD73233.1 MAG: hypothetical protein A3K29_03770 [Candidatus Collierbacteria bacterium RIFOXYB2_FULL_46_14]OGD76275.1 MAG: hypothetical protein A3K43_03770 [Candidatus Collierbacteria bacterium RIFOXYA2_FULL_46_20]OGD77611.1 MAG: hypothetical protein A3K39_03770 [Candidatus Collierbacteri